MSLANGYPFFAHILGVHLFVGETKAQNKLLWTLYIPRSLLTLSPYYPLFTIPSFSPGPFKALLSLVFFNPHQSHSLPLVPSPSLPRSAFRSLVTLANGLFSLFFHSSFFCFVSRLSWSLETLDNRLNSFRLSVCCRHMYSLFSTSVLRFIVAYSSHSHI